MQFPSVSLREILFSPFNLFIMVSISSVEPMLAEQPKEQENFLYDKWVLWAHLPHDTDWTISSYKEIAPITNVEQAIAINETLPEKMIKNCMDHKRNTVLKGTFVPGQITVPMVIAVRHSQEVRDAK